MEEFLMYKIVIDGTPVLFSDFLSEDDCASVIAEATGAARVVFIGTPCTPLLVKTIEELVFRDNYVVVRDNNDILSPRDKREREIKTCSEYVRKLTSSGTIVRSRETCLGCASLVREGEFKIEQTVVVTQLEVRTLLATMKALGVVYDGLDEDDAILEATRRERAGKSFTELLVQHLLVELPLFDWQNPERYESTKAALFAQFVATVHDLTYLS
ncbi:hypothetical protein A3C89_02245 [Candidatus Kaiserbacteria bacterium RIFCSPHIGHO2_02_FULL_50_50]|uniref:Uncharacterized protein n=1 Tax=Candidatus Kaiserbacteria bacterium RIFCSPHIGHO2_02_FULL_50_50 TaxID=1798492 RepID=A0A1F6DFT9_9BACT|nr:MAG: hypothetical protein A3C89_02245 [Candidatus Kaiserbacteria bacterium RIFCSPHIGHO2_02_FULL_50_50]OGG88619.1 MAG: hypothetical protein A3G62_00790 [Candidatus Kaiserbacteria bacterium RIFCSPLOWO2_12_FULL_50_10]